MKSWQLLSNTLSRYAHWFSVIIIVFCLFMLAFTFSQCSSSSSDDEPEPVNPQTLLLKTWTMTGGRVAKDGIDKTSDYAAMTLTFSANGTYAAQHNSALLRSSGTWNWKGNDADKLLLDGELDVTVAALTATRLNIIFTISEDYARGGRSAAVVGPYDVTLTSN